MVSLEWISAHLFYAQPWERFLAEAVKPLVDELRDDHPAMQYFFIRYWEKGPHIRLRIKIQDPDTRQMIQSRLHTWFETYFRSYPSSLPDSTHDNGNYPNNSVQFIPYQRETDRYGGEEAILLAERVFQRSSDTVLSLVASSPATWDYTTAMGHAITLQLIFLLKAGMSLETMITYCRFATGSLSFMTDRMMAGSPQEKRRLVDETFARSFEGQRAQLAPYVGYIREAIAGAGLNDDVLERWAEDIAHCLQELYRLNGLRLLTGTTQPWAIMNSYAHMTNNRLGVHNRDEPFIFYLLQRALEEGA
jgi:thiopeptide-type bacteriocin biosynthesis protein